MITVIAGTNRNESKTEVVAKAYFELLKSNTTEEVQYFSLQQVSPYMFLENMYEEVNQNPELRLIQEQYFINASKWILICPEYNGTFPGILKLFIDAMSIHRPKDTFPNKKLGLIGVAAGRAGNLRGLDHLSNLFNHMGLIIFPNKIPISLIGKFVNNGQITDNLLLDTLASHAKSFSSF